VEDLAAFNKESDLTDKVRSFFVRGGGQSPGSYENDHMIMYQISKFQEAPTSERAQAFLKHMNK